MGQCCLAGGAGGDDKEMTGVQDIQDNSRGGNNKDGAASSATMSTTQPKSFQKADARVKKKAARAIRANERLPDPKKDRRYRHFEKHLKRSSLPSPTVPSAAARYSIVGAHEGFCPPDQQQAQSRLVEKVKRFDEQRAAAEAPLNVDADDYDARSDAHSERAAKPSLARQLSLGMISIGSNEGQAAATAGALASPPPLPPPPDSAPASPLGPPPNASPEGEAPSLSQMPSPGRLSPRASYRVLSPDVLPSPHSIPGPLVRSPVSPRVIPESPHFSIKSPESRMSCPSPKSPSTARSAVVESTPEPPAPAVAPQPSDTSAQSTPGTPTKPAPLE